MCQKVRKLCINPYISIVNQPYIQSCKRNLRLRTTSSDVSIPVFYYSYHISTLLQHICIKSITVFLVGFGSYICICENVHLVVHSPEQESSLESSFYNDLPPPLPVKLYFVPQPLTTASKTIYCKYNIRSVRVFFFWIMYTSEWKSSKKQGRDGRIHDMSGWYRAGGGQLQQT